MLPQEGVLPEEMCCPLAVFCTKTQVGILDVAVKCLGMSQLDG